MQKNPPINEKMIRAMFHADGTETERSSDPRRHEFDEE
jgi:uncharacterized protein YneF (UPF0154 family)